MLWEPLISAAPIGVGGGTQCLAVIGELFARALQPIGPVEFSGGAAAHLGEVTTQDVQARLNRTRVEGSLSGSFGSGRRPRFAAHLHTADLYLDDIGIAPDPSATENAVDDWPTLSGSGMVFVTNRVGRLEWPMQ